MNTGANANQIYKVAFDILPYATVSLHKHFGLSNFQDMEALQFEENASPGGTLETSVLAGSATTASATAAVAVTASAPVASAAFSGFSHSHKSESPAATRQIKAANPPKKLKKSKVPLHPPSGTNLVANPLYTPSVDISSGELSSEAEDDGIIVLSCRKKGENPPTIVISDSDDDEQDVDGDSDDTECKSKPKKRSKMTELEKSFGLDYRTRPKKEAPFSQLNLVIPSRKSFYKASCDSEEEDSCSSSGSVQIVSEGQEEGEKIAENISLNVVGHGSSSYSMLDLEETDTGRHLILEEEVEEVGLEAITPQKWTRDMDRFYNNVVGSYVTADLTSLRSGMDHRADWHVDRYYDLPIFVFNGKFPFSAFNFNVFYGRLIEAYVPKPTFTLLPISQLVGRCTTVPTCGTRVAMVPKYGTGYRYRILVFILGSTYNSTGTSRPAEVPVTSFSEWKLNFRRKDTGSVGTITKM